MMKENNTQDHVNTQRFTPRKPNKGENPNKIIILLFFDHNPFK